MCVYNTLILNINWISSDNIINISLQNLFTSRFKGEKFCVTYRVSDIWTEIQYWPEFSRTLKKMGSAWSIIHTVSPDLCSRLNILPFPVWSPSDLLSVEAARFVRKRNSKLGCPHISTGGLKLLHRRRSARSCWRILTTAPGDFHRAQRRSLGSPVTGRHRVRKPWDKPDEEQPCFGVRTLR